MTINQAINYLENYTRYIGIKYRTDCSTGYTTEEIEINPVLINALDIAVSFLKMKDECENSSLSLNS